MNKSKINWYVKLVKQGSHRTMILSILSCESQRHESVEYPKSHSSDGRQWHFGGLYSELSFLWIPFSSWDICVAYKVPQERFSLMYYYRRKSVKLKSVFGRGVATNQVKSFDWTWNWGSIILFTKMAAYRPSHMINPLLIKETPLFGYFLAPTGCFPFRFSVAHISISHLSILLLLLLKYCFFSLLSSPLFFFKGSLLIR